MSNQPPPSAPGAINQGSAALLPGDLDDCWVVATIYAAKMYDSSLRTPTIPEFRKAAGNVDKPGPTGGTIGEVIKGANAIWPNVTVNGGVFKDWNTFDGYMSKGLRPASVQFRSALLPVNIQYGFTGLHQGCVFKDADGDWWLSNPLQKNGAPPDHIGAATLRSALYAFANDGHVRAALFPVIASAAPDPTVAELEKKVAALESSNATLTAAVTSLTKNNGVLVAKIAAAQKELS